MPTDTQAPTTPKPAESREPSEYALLNRALDRRDGDELAFMRELLKDWAEAPLTCQEAALSAASHHFGLELRAESMDEKDIRIVRSLSQVYFHNPWLYDFLDTIGTLALDRVLTPDDVMRVVADCISEFNCQLKTAGAVLRDYPQLIGEDIRESRGCTGGQPMKNTPEALAIPEWVVTTPEDHSYSLDMYENGDHSIQTIELTREEFIELKAHIARMRGLVPASEPSETLSDEKQAG